MGLLVFVTFLLNFYSSSCIDSFSFCPSDVFVLKFVKFSAIVSCNGCTKCNVPPSVSLTPQTIFPPSPQFSFQQTLTPFFFSSLKPFFFLLWTIFFIIAGFKYPRPVFLYTFCIICRC